MAVVISGDLRGSRLTCFRAVLVRRFVGANEIGGYKGKSISNDFKALRKETWVALVGQGREVSGKRFG